MAGGGGYVLVGLASDAAVQDRKGRRPLASLLERAIPLLACKVTHSTVPNWPVMPPVSSLWTTLLWARDQRMAPSWAPHGSPEDPAPIFPSHSRLPNSCRGAHLWGGQEPLASLDARKNLDVIDSGSTVSTTTIINRVLANR